MNSTLSPNVMLVNDSQPSNAESPILIVLLGMIMLVNDLQR